MSQPHSQSPRYVEMLGRAHDLIGFLRERAEHTENLRRMPDDVEQALHETELFRTMQPARIGGSELGVGILAEVAIELGRGCGSTAWNYGNIASHHWMVGMFPEAAQDRVWGESVDAMIATGLTLTGKAKKVAGGYELSGRWPFSSGVDNCRWNMLAGTVESGGDGPPDNRLFLVPSRDYVIHDTWHAAGLCGTGSNDVSTDGAFVEEDMTLPMSCFLGGPTPGAEVNPGPVYRMPLMALAPYVLGGTAVGIAQGAVDTYVAETRERIGRYFGDKMSDRQVIQLQVADAAAKVDHARIGMRLRCDEAYAEAEAGIVPDLMRKLIYRRDGAFEVKLAVEAVTGLFGITGASGLYLSHPMQRALRDVNAVASHIHLTFDVGGTMYGRAALGLPLEGPPL